MHIAAFGRGGTGGLGIQRGHDVVRLAVTDRGTKGFFVVENKAKRSAWIVILVLPVLFACLGAWESWRGAAMRSTYDQLVVEQRAQVAMVLDHQRHNPGAQIQLPDRPDFIAISAVLKQSENARDSAEIDGLVARTAEVLAWLCVLASTTAALAGAAGLLLVHRSARIGVQSRPRLVVSFGHVVRFLPVALCVQVVGLVLAAGSAVTFEVSGLWFMPDPAGNTVLLAVLVLGYAAIVAWGGITTLRNLRRALRAFVPTPMPVDAVSIVEADAPGLFALLRDLARERGTTLPEVVAVGAQEGFFVTALPLRLYGAPDTQPATTHGRTLHLSLPEMAIADVEELRTVLAHELAHFSGEDTDYSARFQPLYAGLGEGANAMSLRQFDWGGTLVDRLFERAVHPHTTLALHAFEAFSHVVAHWSRLRELEADRAAVLSGSGSALGSLLLRGSISQPLLQDEFARITRQPETASPDIAAALVTRMGAVRLDDAAAHLESRTPHPTDTHPPTRQRIQAVGVPVDETLLARAGRPVEASDFAAIKALFSDWEAVSGGVTDNIRGRAMEQQDLRRARLTKAAAATAGAGETALYGSLLRPVIGLAILGSFCLLIGVGCGLAALYGGDEDRESWRLLAGFVAASAVGFGYVALLSVRVWRGRGIPYLVVSEDGVRSPGFTGTVTWLDICGIGVSARQSPTAWFVLRPDAALPQRTGLIRLLHIDEKLRAVQVMGILPRGLNESTLRALLLRYADAAHARYRLQGEHQAVEPSYSCQHGEKPNEESSIETR